MSTDPKPVKETPKHLQSKPAHFAVEGLPKNRLAVFSGVVSAAAVVALLTFSAGSGAGNIEAVPAPREDPSLSLPLDDTQLITPDFTATPPTMSEIDEIRELKKASRERHVISALQEDVLSTTPTIFEAANTALATATAAATATEEAPRVIAARDRLAWPRTAHATSATFGFRSDPFLHTTRFHTGMDMGGVCGTPVYASEDGVVEGAGPNGGYGNRIVVKHRADLSTTYNHLETILVKKGDKVKLGEKIGLMGTTGRSTGCHLHFEVIKDGYYVSPWSWLTGEPDKELTRVLVGTVFSGAPITSPDVPVNVTTTPAAPTPSPTPTSTPSPTTPPPSSPPTPTPTTPAPTTPSPTPPPPPPPAPTEPAPTTPPPPPPTTEPAPTTPVPAPTTPPAPPAESAAPTPSPLTP